MDYRTGFLRKNKDVTSCLVMCLTRNTNNSSKLLKKRSQTQVKGMVDFPIYEREKERKMIKLFRHKVISGKLKFLYHNLS